MLAPAMDRRMLIFVSDLHLTDTLRSGSVAKGALFERFWQRIQASRGAEAATLVFVGDVFDLVRSPHEVRAAIGAPLPELDDIDDVRPVFAVPAWVRNFATKRDGLVEQVSGAWRGVVDDFLATEFVEDWMRAHSFAEATKLRL